MPSKKSLERKLTERVARDAVSIAIARNDMRWDNEACTEEEIIADTLNVVLGDDTGCLDEDELTPDNCALKFVADLLDEAIREARVSEHKLTCHKPLLQYDAKGKLIGNLRCGEDWACERLAQLEKR